MTDEKLNILTLAMAKKYTDKSLAGAGAVAGVPCQIQSIKPITGGNRITFLWVDNNNVSHTSTLDVMDGAGGEENKIDSISVNGSPISIDKNKNVDITVPSIEGLTKDTDLATVAKSGSYEDLSNKPEIPSIEGLAKTEDIPTTVAELTDSADYAKKTDIPTTLPANGGNSDTVNNHTVKSDVPENAVFTDTIYDDTEVKGSITEINRNLGNCFLNTGIVISNKTDIKSVDDAPIGICFVSKDAVDNPFTFWSTIFTVGYNNDYKQQLAFPWAKNEAIMMKFRVKDNGGWNDWKTISLS